MAVSTQKTVLDLRNEDVDVAAFLYVASRYASMGNCLQMKRV